ncbi:OmpA family protein [Sinimarinibacterium sp. NLF-5-8]|uniref:OmpA family protein n=1 Tax=Sinimarinibacterium sp. NLF-5-8 TaxID=2698684 RepID=UPI00137C099E|nr:OmpA family protein [Sinimarinibacterium sp. NLF-5-8]QHS10927.1 OmpA family protein [Sinimarinibacterium sp. NLF-5-8]
MKKKIFVAAAMASMAWSSAHALEPGYLGLLGDYTFTDSVRNTKDGSGFTLLYGLPLAEALDLEFNAGTARYQRKYASGSDRAHHLGADLRYTFAGTPVLSGFLIGGAGAMFDRTAAKNDTSPYLNVGLGLRVPLIKNWSTRFEVREYATFNDSFKDSTQFDTRLGIGFEYALGTAPAPAPVIVDGDSDGDGVRDSIDQCPGTAPGTPVDAKGCPLPPPDTDGDGVPDSQDRCPGTPAGIQVDANGCPLDDDGDGVPNSLDRCPNTPAGFKVDEQGCVIEKQTVAVLNSVSFEFNSSRLTADAKQSLARVVEGLKGQQSMTVEIAGHTDAIGSVAANQKVSQQRANAVREYLIGQGIAGSRLTAKGYGKAKPIASNDTADGRAENRRVEFHVLTR